MKPWILLSPICALWLAACVQGQAPPSQSIRQEIDRAFAAFRSGQTWPLDRIVAAGDAAVPGVSAHLGDKDPDVRVQAVRVLSTIGGSAACNAMVKGLTDVAVGVREQAAAGIYRRCGGFPPMAAAAEPLRQMVRKGSSEASVFLLLGRYSDAESQSALQAAASGQRKSVALSPGNLVPVGFAVAVAQGTANAGTQELAQRLFLLDALPSIASSKDLLAMTSYLEDVREVRGGVPSGPGVVKRRLCDDALEKLADRAAWKPPFPVNSAARYSEAELRQAKSALQAVWSH